MMADRHKQVKAVLDGDDLHRLIDTRRRMLEQLNEVTEAAKMITSADKMIKDTVAGLRIEMKNVNDILTKAKVKQ